MPCSKRSIGYLSRCGEKDLYDLIWLFGRFEEVETGDLISMGAEIDAGMDAEALLLSIASAPLSEEACDFAERSCFLGAFVDHGRLHLL